MSKLIQTAREPLEDLLREFTYMELEIVPAGGMPPSIGVNAIIEIGKDEGMIAIWATTDFAGEVACNFLGQTSVTKADKKDIVFELLNTMAGQIIETLYAGHGAKRIQLPGTITPAKSAAVWKSFKPGQRFAIRDESRTLALIAIKVDECWSAGWK
jgi:hypothetical protein